MGILFLIGLYISSLASCMGGLYGAPRILQCIAQEKVVPILAFLGKGVSKKEKKEKERSTDSSVQYTNIQICTSLTYLVYFVNCQIVAI